MTRPSADHDTGVGVISTAASDRRWRRGALWLLAISTLLRLVQLRSMELVPDEAYYWDWSRHLSLGYYDQGPMIAYVIRLTTALFGANEFGVRFGVCIASAGAVWCCCLLADRLFSARAGFITLLLLALSPLMAVGSTIATYDPLLVFFWALMLLALERALFARDFSVQRRAWLIVGLTAGMGFLSKHTMLLALPCLLLFLLWSSPHRFWLRRPEPYVALLIMQLLYSGVFWWNAHHHWWTFGHLLFLTHKETGTPLRRLGDFIGSQALLLGPVLFLGCLYSCIRGFRRASPQKIAGASVAVDDYSAERSDSRRRNDLLPAYRFLWCMGAPVFLFFCLISFKAKVQANWAPCAWLSLTVLWAGMLASRANETRNAWRQVALACATGGILTLLLFAPTLRLLLGLRIPPQADVSNTGYGWRSLASHVQMLRTQMSRKGHTTFLAGNGYQYIALMAFYLPDHPQARDLFLHNRLDMYAAHVQELKSHLGEDTLFIDAGQADDHDLRAIFDRVDWQPPFPLWRRPLYHEPIAVIHFARCYGYHRYVGLDWARGG